MSVGLLLVGVLQLLPFTVSADTLPQQLALKEVNISGDEFIVLQNVGNVPIDHLNAYWLGYTNIENTSNVIPSQQLPDAVLEPGEAYLLNGGMADTCGAVGAAKLGFSLSNTSGTVSLRQLTDDGTTSTFQTIQSVSWNANKTSPVTSATYLHLADEANVTTYVTKQALKNTATVWYKAASDASSAWQVGFTQSCSFTPVKTATTIGQNQLVTWPNDTADPPFTILANVTVSDDSASPAIPAVDIGLNAVQLSELVANPASPGTDAEDEFIELYNPNSVGFDLSGFKLQYVSTTSSTVHSYTIPAGTIIDGKSFKAFYSSATHLSLSNSGGKVWLLDPLGTVMGESEVYGTAKEGQAWILAAGKWQWTTIPTPNAANKLAVPVTSSKASTSKNPITALKGATTTSVSGGATNSSPASADEATPVHPWILAAVVIAALLYGAYEYRTDLANYLHQLRRYRAARRSSRG